MHRTTAPTAPDARSPRWGRRLLAAVALATAALVPAQVATALTPPLPGGPSASGELTTPTTVPPCDLVGCDDDTPTPDPDDDCHPLVASCDLANPTDPGDPGDPEDPEEPGEPGVDEVDEPVVANPTFTG